MSITTVKIEIAQGYNQNVDFVYTGDAGEIVDLAGFSSIEIKLDQLSNLNRAAILGENGRFRFEFSSIDTKDIQIEGFITDKFYIEATPIDGSPMPIGRGQFKISKMPNYD